MNGRLCRWSEEFKREAGGELGPGSYVNLMDQYRPAGKVGGEHYAEIDRPLRGGEFAEAVEHARGLGLRLDRHRPAAP